MGFQSVLNGLTDANSTVRDFNQKLTNSNPSQEPGKINKLTTQITGITKTSAGIVNNVTNVGRTIAKVSKTLGATALGELLGGKGQQTEDISTNETTGLKGFYNKFSGKSPYAVNHIDTQNTFDCTFEFEPTIGQYGSFQKTFMSELIENCRIDNQYNVFNTYKNAYESPKQKVEENDIILDLGIYIQKITIPNITTNSQGNVQSIIGEFPLNGTYVKPDSNTLVMEIINLAKPIHELIFYPWMREVQMPKWQYEGQPYTTANITVDMTEHADAQYIFLNCRPSQIMTYQPSQEPNQQITRQVTFVFDYMIIQSTKGDDELCNPMDNILSTSLDTSQQKSGLDKALDIAGATFFAASNTLKI